MKAVPILISLFLFLTGCSVHRTMTTAETHLEIPETFTTGSQTEFDERWWNTFHDNDLTELVESALSDNLTLRAAWSRLDQAYQLARISGASRFPSLNLGLTGVNTHYGNNSGPMGVDKSESWEASGVISWQLDLWKKIANTRKAAVLDTDAGRFEMEATAQTIAASVADTWFALLTERATLQLLSQQARVSRDYLELVEYRFTNGLSTALEVYQQRLALGAVEALVPASRANVTVLENTLNLLLGREPGTWIPEMLELPNLPDRPGTGIPVNVLRSRPDVRSSELRLIAADHRLAAAIADRFPTLGLSYTVGGQSSEFKNVLDDWFWTLAGNLLMPVFDSGRLKAEARRNRAVVDELFFRWESNLLNAWNEVENQLTEEDGLLQTLNLLNDQVALARVTLERSRDQYINGLVDYLNVLASLQNLQQLERQAIRTQQSLLSNRVALHLALGGDWSRNLVRKSDTDVNNTEESR